MMNMEYIYKLVVGRDGVCMGEMLGQGILLYEFFYGLVFRAIIPLLDISNYYIILFGLLNWLCCYF